MLDIIYKDKDIVVCLKPSGFLSEEDGNKRSVPLALKTQLGIKDVFTVHRLDKNVSGVMVFALNSKSASALATQIADKTAKKEYLAVINGVPAEAQGNFFDLLFRDASKNKTYVVKRERKGVRDASLDYEVLKTLEGKSLVRVVLHTGRTHQIRVQFASRGLSLLGDGRYGSRDGGDEPALFSYKLGFLHPKTKKEMCFRAFPEHSNGSLFSMLDGEIIDKLNGDKN